MGLFPQEFSLGWTFSNQTNTIKIASIHSVCNRSGGGNNVCLSLFISKPFKLGANPFFSGLHTCVHTQHTCIQRNVVIKKSTVKPNGFPEVYSKSQSNASRKKTVYRLRFLTCGYVPFFPHPPQPHILLVFCCRQTKQKKNITL